MEELQYIENELERVHMIYLNKCKELWTDLDVKEAEKQTKKEYVKFRNREKLLQLAKNKIESGIEDLKYYKGEK